jgi:hypothetical protein
MLHRQHTQPSAGGSSRSPACTSLQARGAWRITAPHASIPSPSAPARVPRSWVRFGCWGERSHLPPPERALHFTSLHRRGRRGRPHAWMTAGGEPPSSLYGQRSAGQTLPSSYSLPPAARCSTRWPWHIRCSVQQLGSRPLRCLA